jgi:hypothetical protein
MVPQHTRRALLSGTGLAVIVGLAGCRFERVTDEPGGDEQRNPGDGNSGSGGPGTDTGSDGDSSAGGGGSSDGAAGGGSDGDGPSTVEPGSSYTFELENRITAEDLELSDEVPNDTGATVTVDVEAHYDDREDTAFEETLELAPGESKTIEDAFATEPDGPEYVIRTVLEKYPHEDQLNQRTHTAGHRFTPGGFGGPTGTTIELSVVNFAGNDEEERELRPFLVLDVPEGDDGDG